MKKFTQLIGLIIILNSFQALRAEQLKSARLMTISPGKCVVKSEGEPCAVNIDFTFRLKKSGSHCVYHYGQYQPLFCFESIHFSTQQKISTSKDIRFVLVEDESGKTLASSDFTVLTYKPAKISKRRKRAWGIL